MNVFRQACAGLVFALFTQSWSAAEPLAAQRIESLPAPNRAAWQAYLARSESNARLDQAALDAELAKLGLSAAKPAPDGGDFKLSAKPGETWFAGDDAKRLADVVLSYQTPSGGWSKHTGYARGPRQPGMLWSSQYKPGQRPHYLATFDNRSTTEQLHFLASVAQATGREDCRAAVAKGIDFVLAAQYPNGGWPQVYPLEGGYHDDVTLNDDAMTRVLKLLHAIDAGDPAFAFLDAGRRERAGKALSAGVACLLQMQVEIGGKKTVWCAQSDPITLRPSPARKMEPATLSGMESARVLEFLMTLKQPTPQTTAAIEGGLAWLEAAKLTNVRKVQQNGKTAYEIDPNSTEIYWARFYDLNTGKPVFPGRDGVLYPTFAAMAAKNPTGYDYYTTIPGSVLNSAQKKWRKALAEAANAKP